MLVIIPLFIFVYYILCLFIVDYIYLLFQVTVWGDYGRMEGRKVFMGLAQIVLDDLLSQVEKMDLEWYKLFGTNSLVSGPPFLGLSRRTSLANHNSA